MQPILDANAQPNARFNVQQRIDRGIHELIGLCRGLIADGAVADEEAALLAAWIQASPDITGAWPVDILARRLLRIFADGHIDPDERADLEELVAQIVGGQTSVLVGEHVATTLPLCSPPPALRFEGQIYVFTGKFAFGPRSACEDAVHELGGKCEPSITKRTNVVVIGTFGSRDWAHSSFGRKIQKAVDYRENGASVAIVSEDHWAAHLP